MVKMVVKPLMSNTSRTESDRPVNTSRWPFDRAALAAMSSTRSPAELT